MGPTFSLLHVYIHEEYIYMYVYVCIIVITYNICLFIEVREKITFNSLLSEKIK